MTPLDFGIVIHTRAVGWCGVGFSPGLRERCSECLGDVKMVLCGLLNEQNEAKSTCHFPKTLAVDAY
jgi:hypothetical protein